MLPAHERFDTDDAAGAQVDLGLIQDAELVALHGVVQLASRTSRSCASSFMPEA